MGFVIASILSLGAITRKLDSATCISLVSSSSLIGVFPLKRSFGLNFFVMSVPCG